MIAGPGGPPNRAVRPRSSHRASAAVSDSRYLIALGSNQYHRRWADPRRILRDAQTALLAEGLSLLHASAVMVSDPVGPSRRHYANMAIVIVTKLSPPALLHVLQEIEAQFGRRRQGQRWRARTLDLDIILWSGGCWPKRASLRVANNKARIRQETCLIPHLEFRRRSFVLRPAAEIAGRWRDPISHLTMRQLQARLDRAHRTS